MDCECRLSQRSVVRGETGTQWLVNGGKYAELVVVGASLRMCILLCRPIGQEANEEKVECLSDKIIWRESLELVQVVL